MKNKCDNAKCELKNVNDLPNKCVLCGMSKILKAISDMTRLKILLLLDNGDCCVGQLQDKLGVSQSLVSHQLKFLKELNLVKSTKYGNSISYSLSDEHVSLLMNLAYTHIIEDQNEKNI